MDQRNAQARVLRERWQPSKSRSHQPADELALLRDEMLSEIPALDNMLRRSARMSDLQNLLEQAEIKIRAGNILIFCVVSAVGGRRIFLLLLCRPIRRFV